MTQNLWLLSQGSQGSAKQQASEQTSQTNRRLFVLFRHIITDAPPRPPSCPCHQIAPPTREGCTDGSANRQTALSSETFSSDAFCCSALTEWQLVCPSLAGGVGGCREGVGGWGRGATAMEAGRLNCKALNHKTLRVGRLSLSAKTHLFRPRRRRRSWWRRWGGGGGGAGGGGGGGGEGG